MYGIWYMVNGIWYMVFSVWLRVDHGGEGDVLARDERQELVVVYSIRYMVYGIWYMVYSILVYGICYVVS